MCQENIVSKWWHIPWYQIKKTLNKKMLCTAHHLLVLYLLHSRCSCHIDLFRPVDAFWREKLPNKFRNKQDHLYTLVISLKAGRKKSRRNTGTMDNCSWWFGYCFCKSTIWASMLGFCLLTPRLIKKGSNPFRLLLHQVLILMGHIPNNTPPHNCHHHHRHHDDQSS